MEYIVLFLEKGLLLFPYAGKCTVVYTRECHPGADSSPVYRQWVRAEQHVQPIVNTDRNVDRKPRNIPESRSLATRRLPKQTESRGCI